MSPSEATTASILSSGSKAKNGNAGVMEKASLEVSCVSTDSSQGPAMYQVVYTRGGWIWRTSHRYRDWLALKETLKGEFGTRNLPDEDSFPKKEDVGAVFTKLLTSCQGCRQGDGPIGVLEERRQGLQAYFSQILLQHRDMWDGSEDIKRFFFPGPPTSYSAALARRRNDELKEEKSKTKEVASGRPSLASSLKSTFGGIFETTSPKAATSSRAPTFSAGEPMPPPSGTSSSVLKRLSAKMPSIRDVFFDTPAASSSRQGSRHGSDGRLRQNSSSQHSSTGGFGRPVPMPVNQAFSESGTTDPDGISDAGGSKHSMWGTD